MRQAREGERSVDSRVERNHVLCCSSGTTAWVLTPARFIWQQAGRAGINCHARAGERIAERCESNPAQTTERAFHPTSNGG